MASWLQGLLQGGARLLRFQSPFALPTTSAYGTGHELVGSRGQRYTITKVLQDRQYGPGSRRVYLATSDCKQYVLKQADGPGPGYSRDTYDSLQTAKYTRLLHDTVPETSALVFEYMSDHLLYLADHRHLSPSLRKSILRDTLRGIAELHEKRIVHTDIKPDNIMIDLREGKSPVVKITDLEDSVRLDPGYSMMGRGGGNFMWRSPESHCNGLVNTPSDIFSFGATAFYLIYNRILFELLEGVTTNDEERVVGLTLGRIVNWFATPDSLRAMADSLTLTNAWHENFKIVADRVKPLAVRQEVAFKSVDPVFRDLIVRLMDFHPGKRLTAKEALEHPWFADAKELHDIALSSSDDGAIQGGA